MRRGSWLLILLLFCLVGPVAVPRYVPGFLRPDCFIIMLVLVAVHAPDKQALGLCWLSGFARDLMSGGALGAYALLYLVAGFAIVRLRSTTNLRPFLVQAATGFLAAFGIELVYFTVAFLRSSAWPAADIVRILFTASLATGILAAVCSRLLERSGIGRRRSFSSG